MNLFCFRRRFLTIVRIKNEISKQLSIRIAPRAQLWSQNMNGLYTSCHLCYKSVSTVTSPRLNHYRVQKRKPNRVNQLPQPHKPAHGLSTRR